MITVEELIVQSLYHRLVFITVRRTSDQQPPAEDRENANSDGTESTIAQYNGMPNAGLGYLYLGAVNQASNGSADGNLAALSSPDSETVVRALQASGESVQLTRRIQTVHDAGELRMVRAPTSSCSTECQTDFEPMWCFGSSSSQTSADGSGGDLVSHLRGFPSSQGLIDMRNCDQFTIARLEDVRNPSAQSFVMVQSKGANVSDGRDASSRVSAVDTMDMSYPDSDPSSLHLECIGDVPAMFVGNETVWKREPEMRQIFCTDEMSQQQHPADIDSGIWDMVQAFGAGGDDNSRVDLFHPTSERQEDKKAAGRDTNEAAEHGDAGLTGSYRMYNFSGPSEMESAETTYSGNINTDTSSVHRMANGGGGLCDALEPLAAVDFVIHRMDADAGLDLVVGSRQPNITSSGGAIAEKTRVQNRDKLRAEAVEKPLKLDSDPDDITSGKSLQSTDLSSEDGTLADDDPRTDEDVSSAGPAKIGSKSAEIEANRMTTSKTPDQKHKDVVEITSVRLARRSTKRRPIGRYKYWRDSQLKTKKKKVPTATLR